MDYIVVFARLLVMACPVKRMGPKQEQWVGEVLAHAIEVITVMTSLMLVSLSATGNAIYPLHLH